MIRVNALSANEFCFVLFICASIYRSDTFQPIVSDDHSELANVRHTCGHCCHDTSFPKLLSDVRVQVSDCIVLTERAMQGERIDAIHTKNTTNEEAEKSDVCWLI